MSSLSEKPHILSLQYFSYPDEFGGAWNYAYEVNRRLVERGYVVHLFTCNPGTRLPEREVVDGIHYHRIRKSHSKNPFRLYRSLKQGINALSNECQIDLVHIHNPLVGFLALLNGRVRACAKVIHLHSLWHDEEKINHTDEGTLAAKIFLRLKLQVIRLMEWGSFFCADAVLFLSQYTRRLFLDYYPGRKPRLRVISGGVDTERFHPPMPGRDAVQCREALGLEPGVPTLLTVRRLEKRMGLSRLIEAVISIVQRRPELDFRLLIVGKGSLLAELQEQIRQGRIEDKVKLTGLVSGDDLPLYYGAADVFVLPTTYIEGFGLATVEALASGLPVFGTPVGGTVEILKSIDPRLLFANTSANAMADLIEHYLDEPESYHALQNRCREIAVTRYGWEHVVDLIEEEFRFALKK